MIFVSAMQRGVALLFAALVYCSIAQCVDSKDAISKPNIIVVLVDTLRADHLGCYGYDRQTSPTIDALASKGLLFESAYSGSSFTKESVATLFTGMTPSLGGHVGWDAQPADSQTLLAEYLAKQGYSTGLFTNSAVINHPAFFQGFDTAKCLSKNWDFSGGGPRLSNRALRFLDERGKGPFFMYLHFLDPHAPYDPQAEYESRFTRRKSDVQLSLYNDVRPRLNELVADGFAPGDLRYDNLIDRYDAEISFIDSSVQTLLDGLKARGLDENTILILTSDHGEEFLGHGYVEHAWTLYEESVRVPLILSVPGKIAPARVPQPVSLASLYATIVNLLGGPSSDRPSDAPPLLDWKDGQLAVAQSEAPVISELLLPHRNHLRMVRQGNWKYIQAQIWLTPEERPQAVSQQRELIEAYRSGERTPPALSAPTKFEALFDLSKDPKETHDLLPTHGEVANRLRELLEAYKARCSSADAKAQPKLTPQQGNTGEDSEALRSLGYF